jgi:hypothetical protein
MAAATTFAFQDQAASQSTALVALFSQANHQGNVTLLGYGEARANTDDLDGVGNDQTRSILISPGARVRICAHEGGPTGHGVAPCTFLADSTNNYPGFGVSYVEVLPAVTVFAGVEQTGTRASFGPGRWVGTGLSPVGGNNIESLFVPDELTARVCRDAGANNQGLNCQSYSGTRVDHLGSMANDISFIEVTPAPLGTRTLTLTRNAQSGDNRVVSTPLNIDCTGNCSGQFALREEVMLRPAIAAQNNVTYTGCDRVVGNRCYVTMSSNKTVSAYFTQLDEECFENCQDSCTDDCRDCFDQCSN